MGGPASGSQPYCLLCQSYPASLRGVAFKLVSLKSYVVDQQLERPGFITPAEEDAHQARTVGGVEVREPETVFFPRGTGLEAPTRRGAAGGRGEDHHLVGLAVALGPEGDRPLGREVRRRHRE